MIPAKFEYHRPRDLAQVIELLEQFGDDAKLLAGGHSLLPTMKVRMAQPQHLIDLASIPALKGISIEQGYLRIGALTTHWEVESSAIIKSVIPVLSEVASIIADPQVRNRGTMGGSISNADPAADYPASVVALEAQLVCMGQLGIRIVEGRDWFQGLFATGLGDRELLQEIRFPLPPARTAAAYLKYPHPASRFAVIGVMAVLTVDEKGICKNAKIGITGAGTHAVRAIAVEQALIGRNLHVQLIEEASVHAPNALDINEDMHFTNSDRSDLSVVYVKRALIKALERLSNNELQSTI